MTARRLWFGIAFYWAAAAAAVVFVQPSLARWPTPAAAALGGVAGAALFARRSARRPRVPRAAVAAVVAVSAVAEELVWRGVVLASLAAAAGPVGALLASSLLFAYAHTGARRSHVATGLAFGAVYLATGGVVASCCAHAIYNLAVAGALR